MLMKAFIQSCLLIFGSLAVLGALACAFVTFTNDYRLIIATGVILGATSLSCFTGLILWRRKDAGFYIVIGVLPSLVALAELGRRAINGFMR